MQPVCLFLAYEVFRQKWSQNTYPSHLSSPGKPPSLMTSHCSYSVVHLTISKRFIKTCFSETTVVKIFLATCTVGYMTKSIWFWKTQLHPNCYSSGTSNQYLWHCNSEFNVSAIKFLAWQNKNFFRKPMGLQCLCYASGDDGNWLLFLSFRQFVGPNHVEYTIPLVPDSSLLLSWVAGSYVFIIFKLHEFA